MFGQTIVLASCLAILQSVAQAHMVLSEPAMFPQEDFDNGPLWGPSTPLEFSDYPCKKGNISTYDSPRTKYAPGGSYKVSFIGSSVHGGGSCQFSLTKDLTPTRGSEFKVIHSIEGDCPARNQSGNLPTGAHSPDPYSYDFTVPSDLEPGDYTFAWTWFNKIGNREMYMNCAPITITGGSKAKRDASAFNSLPNLFLANIPGIKCASPPEMHYPNGSGIVLKYPNPGSSVQTNTDNNLFQLPLGPVDSCYAPASGSSGAGKSGSSLNASPPAAGAPAPAPAAQPSYSPAPGVSSAAAPAPAPSSPPGPSSAPAYNPPPPASTPVSGGGGASSGSCTGGKVSCSQPGSIVCVGAAQFGLCDLDNCAVPQALAAGTHCVGGVISKRYVPNPPVRGEGRGAHAFARAFHA